HLRLRRSLPVFQRFKLLQATDLIQLLNFALATIAQRDKGAGKRIKRDDPAPQCIAKLRELFVMIGKLLLALFKGLSSASMLFLEHNFIAQGDLQLLQLLASHRLCIADSGLTESHLKRFYTLAQRILQRLQSLAYRAL